MLSEELLKQAAEEFALAMNESFSHYFSPSMKHEKSALTIFSY